MTNLHPIIDALLQLGVTAALVSAATFWILDWARRYAVRDRQRRYTTTQRARLAALASGRCEHKNPLWFRCHRPGEHADHVMPWSRGGRTTIENGQWLCATHNLRKSNRIPSPFYRWRLARRRASYQVIVRRT